MKVQLEGNKLHHHPERITDFLAGRTVWPIYAEVSPTSCCNHRCLFCNFNYLGHEATWFPRGRMVSLMGEFARAGLKAVVFAGSGEPSRHPDTFPAIREARGNGMDVAMSTNGALLREDQIEEMAELLTWIRFSINGGDPDSYARVQGAEPGDLVKALENMRRLADRRSESGSRITIGSQCVLLPENKDSVIELARRVKDAGADYFSIKHYYAHDRNAYCPDMSFLTPEYVENMEAFAREISGDGFVCLFRSTDALDRERPYDKCFGLPFIIYVREDGNVYSCFSHQEDPLSSLGNIADESFEAVWLSRKKQEAFAHINEAYDKNACQANCRHNSINAELWRLRHPPDHVNFI